MSASTKDADDIAVWPNGDWCYRRDLEEEVAYSSDDFEILRYGTLEYEMFCAENDI
jgi:hypothetical protein